MINVDVNFTAKQSRAFQYLNDDKTTELLYGGSAGGGKTWLGCAWIIINCFKYPGSRWLIGRSTLKALKQTTLKSFFEIATDWGISSEYNYNAQSNEIKFNNGSEIILKDLFLYPSDSNFDSLGSLELTGAFIDECNQITEMAKSVVSSRLRYKLDDYNIIPKMLMTCNPAKNWCYHDFYKKNKENKLEDYKQFIQALVTDNPNISPHYIENLKKLDETSKRRLLYGEWEYEDKEAIIDYDNIIDIFRELDFEYDEEPKSTDYFISCDVARKGKDKAVILLWYKLNIIDSFTLDISLITDIKNKIDSLKSEYGITNGNIVIDEDGVGGGLVDMLSGCVGFVNNSKALNGDNYQNLKTQCYFKLAELINKGSVSIYKYSIEEKEKIIQELATIKRKNLDKDGKLQIIGKDEIKNLIGRSPDYTDAMMMRMYFEFKRLVMTDMPIFTIR